MNDRQKELLRILLVHGEGAMRVKVLAEKLDCAEKTVRNDLDRLEEFLKPYSSTNLIRKPGSGVTIDIDEVDRSEILSGLLANEPKALEERLFEMVFQLLTSQKPITLQFWADRYYAPIATIKKDIETISNWLTRYELNLVSKQRLGHMIQGSELKKRNALAHLPDLIPSISSDKNPVLDLFLPYEVTVVKKALQELQARYSLALTDGAFEGLLVHTLIMVKRTRQRSPVFVQESERKIAKQRKEYDYASWFFDQLKEAFQLTFPEEERVYFIWHLISSKRLKEGFEAVLQYDEETTEIVQALISKMEKLTLFPFLADSILMNGLAVHIHSVINRIKYGFPITNPLLVNIKRMYPYMFSMVILALEELKSTFSIEIPEDEAAYIVLHFQASLERMEGKRTEDKKRALIVCHMGIGMSHLLEAKIEQQYQDIDILACIGKVEVDHYVQHHQPDFIISTVPLEKVSTKHIVISPLLGQEDKQKLRQFVEELGNENTSLAAESALASLLKEAFFQIDKEHRYEVVELLAMSLFEKGYVRKEYVQSALNRERSSATAIGGGIAIPHGDPSFVQTSAIAVGVLKHSMDWGMEHVSLVFLLAISKEDQGSVRAVMGKIASLSESPLVVLALTGAKNVQDFIQILKRS